MVKHNNKYTQITHPKTDKSNKPEREHWTLFFRNSSVFLICFALYHIGLCEFHLFTLLIQGKQHQLPDPATRQRVGVFERNVVLQLLIQAGNQQVAY